MIPHNLTHTEAGAFLVAVGQRMIDYDVNAGAVLEPELLKDDDYATRLAHEMIKSGWREGIDILRALKILNELTLEEAIAFNEVDR